MALRTQFPLSAFEIRDELGIASNLSISMLSDAVRTLAGQPTGDVKFSELLGKSNRTPLFDVLVVAGGGGGAGRSSFAGGGGGGGGVIYTSDYSVSAGTTYNITVGGGGTRATAVPEVNATSGQNSSFASIVTIGGGAGSFGNDGGIDGGSGGGTALFQFPGGLGTPGQGNNGAAGTGFAAGGGGGATSAASFIEYGTTLGGNGGNGLVTSISGTSLTYGGGGGGGGYGNSGGAGGGSGGSGAGAGAAAGTPFANQGGGGGGAPGQEGDGLVLGSSGAAGVVIISYPQQYSNAASVSGSFTLTIANGRKIYKWTSGSGSITF